MIFGDLTREQRRLADHAQEAFTGACPGAGKTRTIIERVHVIGQTKLPRKGVAVLSFTNTAVEEFLKRCRSVGAEALTEFPSFVGTFDAFLRHFIVLPAGVPGYRGRPTVVDSWDRLGIEIRLAGARAFRGPGASLDDFDPTTGELALGRVDNRLRQHATQHKQAYEDAARRRRDGLFRAGYLSAADVRDVAVGRIRDIGIGPALGAALAGRFIEVIVDEAQDCNPQDLEIVRWLRQQGLRVSLVHDIDQAIYGFRQGEPAHLADLANEYGEANRLPLTGNFRSSPAICSLASTLRPDGRVDEAVGEHREVDTPIIVLRYRGATVSSAIGAAFEAQLGRFGIVPTDAIILAHGRRSARIAAGIATETSVGTSRVETLAAAVGQFWSPASGARGREASLSTIEGLLLELQGLQEDHEPPSRSVWRLGLDSRVLRRQALSVATNVPAHCGDTDVERAAWLEAARSEVESLRLKLPEGITIRGFLRTPQSGTWSKHLEAAAGANAGVAYATIHEAKGREYEAVCLVIPPNRAPENRTNALFDAWEGRADSESKRVIYVGATRAKVLLCLAVPQGNSERLVALLDQAQVPHDVADV